MNAHKDLTDSLDLANELLQESECFYFPPAHTVTTSPSLWSYPQNQLFASMVNLLLGLTMSWNRAVTQLASQVFISSHNRSFVTRSLRKVVRLLVMGKIVSVQ